MDTKGRITRRCKCGATVYYDRDCHECGEKSTVADDLSSVFREMIRDEVPDPAGKVREALIRNDKLARRVQRNRMRKRADAEEESDGG